MRKIKETILAESFDTISCTVKELLGKHRACQASTITEAQCYGSFDGRDLRIKETLIEFISFKTYIYDWNLLQLLVLVSFPLLRHLVIERGRKQVNVNSMPNS
jgi:hypothetical protein